MDKIYFGNLSNLSHSSFELHEHKQIMYFKKIGELYFKPLSVIAPTHVNAFVTPLK